MSFGYNPEMEQQPESEGQSFFFGMMPPEAIAMAQAVAWVQVAAWVRRRGATGRLKPWPLMLRLALVRAARWQQIR